MRKSKLLITAIMLTTLVGTGWAYAINTGMSTVQAETYNCPIKKCTRTYEHKHKICTKKNCPKTKTHCHNGVYYKGHSKHDGHKYHSLCKRDGCKKLKKHTHGSGHHGGSGHGHHGGQ